MGAAGPLPCTPVSAGRGWHWWARSYQRVTGHTGSSQCLCPTIPAQGAPLEGIKMAFSPFFLCFNPDQFTDPSLIRSSGRHEGRGRGMGRSPRPKLHSPNCAGTAGPAASWEQQLSNTMAWPQKKPRTACAQLAQPCPVSYKPGTRNQLSVPSESGSGARALRDTLGRQSAPEV